MSVENDHNQEPSEILELVTAIGVATLLGVSRQRVSQLLHARRLPAPIARINGVHPAWSPLQFAEADAECSLASEVLNPPTAHPDAAD